MDHVETPDTQAFLVFRMFWPIFGGSCSCRAKLRLLGQSPPFRASDTSPHFLLQGLLGGLNEPAWPANFCGRNAKKVHPRRQHRTKGQRSQGVPVALPHSSEDNPARHSLFYSGGLEQSSSVPGNSDRDKTSLYQLFLLPSPTVYTLISASWNHPPSNLLTPKALSLSLNGREPK